MSDHRILIQNATVLTVDPNLGQLDRADVLIEGSRIAAVGHGLDATDCEVIDATGHIVMPGFVDSHRHLWQSLIRHIGSDWTHGQYLTGVHLGLSGDFRPQDTYLGNLWGALEALDSGITTLLDWSHNIDTPQHADAAVEALVASGMRAVFAHGGGASMWNLPSTVPHTHDVMRIRDQYFSSTDQLVTMAFALRGPQFSVPDVAHADWALVRESGLRVTVHNGDGEWGKRRPVAWMHDNGMLNDTVTHVHCSSLSPDEFRMIADSGGTASVSADVEAQMGLGWPATGRLLDVGVRPSLSVDVCVSNGGDMFNAMKATIGIQRALDNAAEERPGEQDAVRLSCSDVIEFATLQGARALGLDTVTGSLTPGKDADLIMVRADGFAMTPLNNPAGALVYSGHPGLVDSVFVRGQAVKRHGRLLHHDIDQIKTRVLAARDYLFEAATARPSTADAHLGGSWTPGIHKVQR
ncbi:amidohydrolase family protein [Allobranchiibius sp. GilTou38]|uniref:amidohydrolase family protein n=1 Tax=Allobranchiibius sp. GilTou38 TaxID=2815210 RepID=UPI001AA1B297|nr:amidohydrolase family protein [Allobranchiibius sp. GilTou38]MBO1766744.1 amidohydrolase family protein [Allobranchiibius sp. GilTou38]